MYNYHVDIVVCLDRSGDMSRYMDEAKEQIKTFPEQFVSRMEEEGQQVAQTRIKLITFTDFKTEGANAIHETDFFDYFSQQEEFFATVDGIKTGGGGDKPENALEALALAIKSKWTTGGDRRRHMVLMLTNAPAHPLQYRADCEGYPEGMPKDLAELGDWWQYDELEGRPFDGTYCVRAGRLIIYAPEQEPWTYMASWNRLFYCPSLTNSLLFELPINELINIFFD